MSSQKFICPNGHITHASFSWRVDATEEVVQCSSCPEQAIHWVKTVGKVQGKPSVKMRRFECKSCGHSAEINIIRDDLTENLNPRQCPHCTGPMHFNYGGWSIDRFGEDTNWPYFDRGLGRMLHSKKHRQEVMKEMGVVAIDGDIDFSSDYNKLEAKQKADDKLVEDHKKQVEESAAYAEYREAKDRGALEQFRHRDQGTGPKIDPFNELPPVQEIEQ
tara:strand:- start:3427 stop:4080 length:654 start_codon:yes stop_codon:yes gene_type:complete